MGDAPFAGVVSDGQTSIRKAVAKALPGVPHQLCHFHYLRVAALPVYEADRHPKVQLKKKVCGVRPIERKVEGRDDTAAALEAADLIPPNVVAWRELRPSLERRKDVLTLGRCFRRDPDAYLRSLEESLVNQALPP